MTDELLMQLQQVETNILADIDLFCKKNNIKYSLYGGTAIGAIRHKGFIPWDDDIDICMSREEYNKFVEQWKKTPIEGYYMQEPNENSTINHTKIRKDKTILSSKKEFNPDGHNGIWLDIFPMDKVPTKKIKYKLTMIRGKIMLVFTRGYPYNKGGKMLKFISKIMLLLPKKLQKKCKKKLEIKIQKNINYKRKFIWKSFSSPYELKIDYKENIFDNYDLVDFEGHKFMISSEYDYMLRQCYGDYNILPPEEQRVCRHNPEIIKFNED